MKLPNCGLYAITNGPRHDLLEAVEAALAGGIALLQYRDKTNDFIRRRNEAAALVKLCANYNVPLLVNDDATLAVTVGAAGVHLGTDDIDPTAARKLLGAQAIIGVSCYNSLSRAEYLTHLGVDYLAFGSFFSSPTKPNAHSAEPQLITAAKILDLPLVAIGGIRPDNGSELIAAGADFLAVISGVFGASNPTAAARQYAELFTSKL